VKGDISKKIPLNRAVLLSLEVSRPKNKTLEITLFETSKIITHPVEPIDIALRE